MCFVKGIAGLRKIGIVITRLFQMFEMILLVAYQLGNSPPVPYFTDETREEILGIIESDS